MIFKDFFQFGKVEKEIVESTKNDQMIDSESDNPKSIFDDDIAKNLMILIGKAIEEWARQYGMQNLPKDIIFNQALNILNAWNDTLKKGK